jgi:hypothetical protein
MIFDIRLHLDFAFSPRKDLVRMSERSEKLAAYVRQFKENKPTADEATVRRHRTLDEGFERLQEELKSEFAKQVEELNHEPGCADFLVCKFSNVEPGVYRTDDSDSHVSVKFDPPKRAVTITCDRPTKLKYIIEVRLTNDETSWYFAAGENKKDLSSCGERVDWVVEKALYALVGIGA